MGRLKRMAAGGLLCVVVCTVACAQAPDRSGSLVADSTQVNLMLKLDIIDPGDETNSGSPTVLEGLRVIYRLASGCREEVPEGRTLGAWYKSDYTEHLDYLDDKDKYALWELGRDSVLLEADYMSLAPEALLSQGDLLTYLVRLLGSTNGCVQIKEEAGFTTWRQTVDRAVEQGLVDQGAVPSQTMRASWPDLIRLVYRALYVELERGSAGGVVPFRYIDMIEQVHQRKADEEEKARLLAQTLPVRLPAPHSPVLHEDLSMSWMIPKEGMEQVDGYWVSLIFADEEEKRLNYRLIEHDSGGLKTEWVLEYLLTGYPEAVAAIRVRYTASGINVDPESGYMDIDTTDILVRQAGSPLVMDTLREEDEGSGAWRMTLGGADRFFEGRYYCVTSRDLTSRNPDYHRVSRYAFRAGETAQTCLVDGLFGYLGGGSREHVVVQEMQFSKIPGDGIEVVFTPEPETPFGVA